MSADEPDSPTKKCRLRHKIGCLVRKKEEEAEQFAQHGYYDESVVTSSHGRSHYTIGYVDSYGNDYISDKDQEEKPRKLPS
jgi:hypothetical protein